MKATATNCPMCGKLRRKMRAHILWCQCDSCPHRVAARDTGPEIPPGCDLGHWEATAEGRHRGQPPAYPCMDREAALYGAAQPGDEDVTPELDFEDTSWMDEDEDMEEGT